MQRFFVGDSAMLFVQIFAWETFQNAGAWMAMIIAAKLYRQGGVYRYLALLVLVIGMVLTAIAIALTERYKDDVALPTIWTIISLALIFFAFAVPSGLYIASDWKWVSWKSDIAIGLLIGLLDTILETVAMGETLSRALPHALAFAVAFPLSLIGFRYVVRKEWPTALALGVGLTLVASFLIAAIDYFPNYA
jgi:hypothetical protein